MLRVRKWYSEVGRMLVLAAVFLAVSDDIAYTQSFIFDGHNVYVADTQVGLTCFAFDKPFLVADHFGGRILVSDEFFRMHPSWKTAFLYHESGHLVLGHRTSIIDLIKRQLGDESTWEIEFEADEYAAQNGYARTIISYFNAINEMYGMYDGTYVPELRARVSKLEEWHDKNSRNR